MSFGEALDVSAFNGPIDWPRVRASGIVAVWIRALIGRDTQDARLFEHANGARAAGVPFGIYGDDFPRHLRRQDAEDQARQLVAIHHEVGAQLVPMMDVEPEGVEASGAEWLASVDDYISEIHGEIGRCPLLYTGPGFWAQYPELWRSTWATMCPLWLAAYLDVMPPAPKPWTSVSMWQRQGGGPSLPERFRGLCDGVSGDVDVSDLLVPLSDLTVT